MEASPRGRLLAFAPTLHLLLRALWVAGVLNIAKDVVHCARLQSTTSVLDDHRCNLSLSFALAMLFISLLGRSILRRSDAKAEAEVGIHDTSPRALLDLFILVTSDISIWG
jgi:hypothetical protein